MLSLSTEAAPSSGRGVGSINHPSSPSASVPVTISNTYDRIMTTLNTTNNTTSGSSSYGYGHGDALTIKPPMVAADDGLDVVHRPIMNDGNGDMEIRIEEQETQQLLGHHHGKHIPSITAAVEVAISKSRQHSSVLPSSSSSTTNEPLLHAVYPRRYWMLTMLSVVAAQQTSLWMSYRY